MTSLVVSGNSDINPVERGVGIGEGNDGDVHVRGFVEALVVKAGVADNDESGLEEPIIKYKLELKERQQPIYLLLGVLVSQSSGDPLATEVFGTGVGGELEHGSLSVLTGGHNLCEKWSY